MVKRHAPNPFILSISPSLLLPFPGILPCIPLPLLNPHTFFKEMRYNLQDRSCEAFSDKALMAAQGELHSYTFPRWPGTCEHLQTQLHQNRVWGDMDSSFPGYQRDMQMRHSTQDLRQKCSINPSLPWAAWKTGIEVMFPHRQGGKR